MPIGKAIVRREGTRPDDHQLRGDGAHVAWKPPEQLAKEGIEAEVIDLRTLLPLDRETILASVKKTNKLADRSRGHAHGRHRRGNRGHRVRRAFEDLDGPIARVTALDTPVPYAPTLEERFLPNTEKVVAAARELAKY